MMDALRTSDPLLRRAIYLRDGGLCGFCGEAVPISAFHLDHHPIPRLAGGPTTMDNLRLAHPRCNIAANAKGYERPEVPAPPHDEVADMQGALVAIAGFLEQYWRKHQHRLLQIGEPDDFYAGTCTACHDK